ncbi:MAG: GatB/YqeY domain-containing protein [Candidatus Omnitrophica bacterium]|nr:GatB/YqeY domain-containing protein [Candidatus Omnitrophota bacterium]
MLKERIDNELKEAMKGKDAVKVSTLRLLKAAMCNDEIAKKEDLTDDDIMAAIKRQISQRKDSIEGFEKGGRQDLVEKEKKELEILKAYMPEEIDPGELLAIVKEAVAETGAVSPREMGKVMKVVMGKVKNRADGKTISALVNKELAKNTPPQEEDSPKEGS